ncbi:glycosyltransferase family 2 protein [Demequina activiva]|uniref:Glycosyl transferase n=1 Tax=Demequina activiva TaxID=1582364 RepID=A0A919UII6_9MICO|nr:glycosyltransferase [Demequina activiva]GIG53426.1 glycosyl transferase [Demequina activiva]
MSTLSAAVAFATAGRPDVVAQAMADIDQQTHPVVARVLSVPDEDSLPSSTQGWTVVTGPRGAAAQRNTALAALPEDVDVVFFFDDDAVIRQDYVAHAMALFAQDDDVVGLTGRVLLDGAAHSVGEVPRDAALDAIEASRDVPATQRVRRLRTLYGCNFAFRRSAVPELRFDARLPLYSWLEDHDFARRLMRHGTLVGAEDCVIVHRGVSSGGRTNHVRLGYSQLINPVHLARSGSFPVWLAAWEIFRPTSKNLAYAIAGPQASWRRERVRGNVMGLGDAIRGRITPERILDL